MLTAPKCIHAANLGPPRSPCASNLGLAFTPPSSPLHTSHPMRVPDANMATHRARQAGDWLLPHGAVADSLFTTRYLLTHQMLRPWCQQGNSPCASGRRSAPAPPSALLHTSPPEVYPRCQQASSPCASSRRSARAPPSQWPAAASRPAGRTCGPGGTANRDDKWQASLCCSKACSMACSMACLGST